MWNIQSNKHTYDDMTWWDAGGNALWAQFATPDNVEKTTNTMFLTDEEWEQFKAKAEKLEGWLDPEKCLVSSPLVAIKQEITLYVCMEPRVWLWGHPAKTKAIIRQRYLHGTLEEREAVCECVSAAIEDVLAERRERFVRNGITIQRIPRLYGTERIAAEWQGDYGTFYFIATHGMCRELSSILSNDVYNEVAARLPAVEEKLKRREMRKQQDEERKKNFDQDERRQKLLENYGDNWGKPKKWF